MKKQTLFAVLFLALLTGCAVIESSSTYSSEAIRAAELGTLSETQQPKTADIDYYVSIDQDSLKVTDPETGATIYSQSFDKKTAISEAIIKDNQ